MTKDKSQYKDQSRRGFKSAPGISPTIGSSIYIRKLTRTLDGVSNPQWRDQVLRGQNATTSMNGTFAEVDAHQSHFKIKWAVNVNPPDTDAEERGWGYPISNKAAFVVGNLSTQKAQRLAATKYLQKIRQAAVQFSGPIFLGEAAETRRMLRRPGEALYDSAKNFLEAVKRKKRLNPRTWAKGLAGAWLEHAFGWQPFLNDIEDAAKAYRRLHQPRQIKISASGIDSAPFYNQGTIQDTLSISYGPATLSYPFILKTVFANNIASVRYKGALWAQAEMTQWQKDELFGFTPSEFIPTAWELLPWSFLVDYFTNIGDILSSAVTDTAVVRWTNVTVRQTGEHFVGASMDVNRIISSFPKQYALITGSPGSVTSRVHTVGRYANSGIYLPEFAWELPGSAKRLANIAALLALARGIHPQNGPTRAYHPNLYGYPRTPYKPGEPIRSYTGGTT